MATRITSAIILCACLTGCASQQMAQRHWQWLTEGNTGGGAAYSSGVNVQTITVNSQSYRVVTPIR